jgi:hypothetical protein
VITANVMRRASERSWRVGEAQLSAPRRFTLAGFLTGFLAIDLTRLQLLAVNESSLRSTGV